MRQSAAERFENALEVMMRILVFTAALITAASTALADSENFDQTPPGSLPPNWVCGVTGKGSPVWKVEADQSAPSVPNILKQSGSGTFPWCVKKDVSIKDGYAEVKFKPLAGSEDQAGGVVWRWKDGDNYYVARANALENNVTIFHTVKGTRRQFKSVNMKVTSNQWHTLRVEFEGERFKVLFDGKAALEASDDTFKEPGAIGVWTKADSVTAFDDFSFGGK
jgi:FtsP/CotA-like multicopper oxidase with cupredoxin domain